MRAGGRIRRPGCAGPGRAVGGVAAARKPFQTVLHYRHDPPRLKVAPRSAFTRRRYPLDFSVFCCTASSSVVSDCGIGGKFATKSKNMKKISKPLGKTRRTLYIVHCSNRRIRERCCMPFLGVSSLDLGCLRKKAAPFFACLSGSGDRGRAVDAMGGAGRCAARPMPSRAQNALGRAVPRFRSDRPYGR